MDVGDSKIVITVDDKKYEVDIADLTGSDTNAFRQAVGISPAQALVAGLDLDCIAGFVWLVRRRRDKSLSYDKVAKTITWRNVDLEDGDAPDAEEPDSPEV